MKTCFALKTGRKGLYLGSYTPATNNPKSLSIMSIRIFSYYILTLLISSFLFLSIIFSYGLLAPLHILIILVLYDNLLEKRNSILTINKLVFISLPILTQNLLLIAYLFYKEEILTTVIVKFYSSWIGTALILCSIFELLILNNIYSKRKKRTQK